MSAPEGVATLNMDRIVARVEAAGFAAYVEQTGGGCMTIYAGTEHNDRYDAVAGPGWQEGGWLSGGPNLASPEDFYVGPDDDGQILPETVTTEDRAVEIIVGMCRAAAAVRANAPSVCPECQESVPTIEGRYAEHYEDEDVPVICWYGGADTTEALIASGYDRG